MWNDYGVRVHKKTIESLRSIHSEWPSMTPSDRMSFVESRLMAIKEHREEGVGYCKSSGSTSGSETSYLWGPHFNSHRVFYHNLFFDGMNVAHVILRSSLSSPFKLTSQLGKEYFILVDPRYEQKEKIRDTCISINPDVLWHVLNVNGYNFLNLFDMSTCPICLTGSAATEELVNAITDKGWVVRDYMRNWLGGATFYTCPFGSKHWLEYSSVSDISPFGELISTDLWNQAQVVSMSRTGDHVNIKRKDTCQCGQEAFDIIFEHNPRTVFIGLVRVDYDSVFTCVRSVFGRCILVIEYDDELMRLNVYDPEKIPKDHVEKVTCKMLIKKIVDSAPLSKVEVRVFEELPRYNRKTLRFKKMSRCDSFCRI